MNARSETRVSVAVPIWVYGTDAEGNAFTRSVTTLDVSLHGARIEGVASGSVAGQILGLRYRDEKARFRVVWAAPRGSDQQQMGLCCVERDAYIWDFVMPEQVGVEADMAPFELESRTSDIFQMTPVAPIVERRAGRRFIPKGTAELRPLYADFANWANLYDLSASGCYLETRCPWPVGQCLRMCIETLGIRFQTRALVVTSHPLIGMGLRFIEMSQANRLRLKQIISTLQHCQDSMEESSALVL